MNPLIKCVAQLSLFFMLLGCGAESTTPVAKETTDKDIAENADSTSPAVATPQSVGTVNTAPLSVEEATDAIKKLGGSVFKEVESGTTPPKKKLWLSALWGSRLVMPSSNFWRG